MFLNVYQFEIVTSRYSYVSLVTNLNLRFWYKTNSLINNGIKEYYPHTELCGAAVAHLTHNQEVPGSIPGWRGKI